MNLQTIDNIATGGPGQTRRLARIVLAKTAGVTKLNGGYIMRLNGAILEKLINLIYNPTVLTYTQCEDASG